MKIALCGKMRSGKSTIADILVEDFGFKEFRFAQGIGNIVSVYFPEAYEKGKPRKHYQFIGQKLRELNEDVWVDYIDGIIKRNQSFSNDELDIVISDVRQPNELDYVRNNGFLIIKVVADDETRMKRILQDGDSFNTEDFYHETEQYIDDMEIANHIYNSDNYSLDDIRNVVKNCVDNYDDIYNDNETKLIRGGF